MQLPCDTSRIPGCRHKNGVCAQGAAFRFHEKAIPAPLETFHAGSSVELYSGMLRSSCQARHILTGIQSTATVIYYGTVVDIGAYLHVLVLFGDQSKRMVELLFHEFNFFLQSVKVLRFVGGQQMTIARK